MSIGSEVHWTVSRRRALVGVLLGLLTSCSSPTQPGTATGPPGTNGPPTAPPSPPSTLPPAPPFPGLSRPGVIYVGDDAIYDVIAPYHGSRLASRYVLYDDNSFELQFVGARFGFVKYTGRVSRENSRITFAWDGWSTAGPWGAIGTLRGDSLRVEYNLIMQHTDFIDGVYVRAPGTP